ncbi:hypothetical protein [Brevifollis gellanilyticus]|uniref:Uncharacterized protein n=1 Tax=Brevifollis gellanilyticus TaxID=748831 RepID=A0A512M864_9BACT|nr:hypothetical protein [Brevifollis gellanilyticus]GEP42919.1 hypothetical protein BGE01nite_22100 [Brevifollis gellanilyticus]
MLAPSFIVLSLVVAAILAVTSRNRWVVLGILAWLVLTGILAARGSLRDFSSLPPAAPVLFYAGFIMTMWVALSKASASWLLLPLPFFVGFQSFRILVELCIHEAVTEDIAPPQMTWSGLNFDIVSGVTALLLAPFAGRVPRGVLLAWNILGLCLLVWVVSVATLSFPTRFQMLTPANSWVADFPYVWLPTVHVCAALLMHVILFRRLRR